MPPERVKNCLSRMSGKLSCTVLRRGEGSNPFSLVDYTSNDFRQRIIKAGMTQSMSRVARCIDNGPMEGFCGLMKREMYYTRKYQTKNELVKAIHSYMDYYTNGRVQRKPGVKTPMEYHEQMLLVA